MRNRPDGSYLADIPTLRRIMPYLMRTRAESLVYYPQRIEVEDVLAWLDDVNADRTEDERITFFHVFLTALGRTLKLRPETNRFVAGRRTYAHDEISVSFIVKETMTDEGAESEVRLVLTGDETVDDVRRLADRAVRRERAGEQGSDDKLVDLLVAWPRPVLELVAKGIRTLDYHNVLPRFLTDAIPLYTSAYVVNAGSIGIDPPFHHLYEVGSASAFVAIGRIAREPVVSDDGTVVARSCVNVVYTIDERASDGFYFAKSAEVIRRLVAEPPLLADPGITVEKIVPTWPPRRSPRS